MNPELEAMKREAEIEQNRERELNAKASKKVIANYIEACRKACEELKKHQNPLHSCGAEMREALVREIEHLGEEYKAGDYGKIWVCDKCHVLIVCNV